MDETEKQASANTELSGLSLEFKPRQLQNSIFMGPLKVVQVHKSFK